MTWKVVSTIMMISMMVMVGMQVNVEWAAAACTGNELNSVIRGCAPVVLSGARPNLGSPCCNSIRTVSFPCLCAQLANSPYANSINPSVANSIKSSCQVRTPKGLRCAGIVFLLLLLIAH